MPIKGCIFELRGIVFQITLLHQKFTCSGRHVPHTDPLVLRVDILFEQRGYAEHFRTKRGGVSSIGRN